MTVTKWPAALALLKRGYHFVSLSKDREGVVYTVSRSRPQTRPPAFLFALSGPLFRALGGHNVKT
jgi:hypothetical protein